MKYLNLLVVFICMSAGLYEYSGSALNIINLSLAVVYALIFIDPK